MKNHIANPLSVKILVLKLWAQTLMIAEFFKVNISRKKWEMGGRVVQVDFLLVDKHQSFLQVLFIVFGGRSQICSKYP